VLNTLTKHDFQDAFKKMADVLGEVHMRERGPVGSKSVFDQMPAPV
jgi:hypothetical protein